MPVEPPGKTTPPSTPPAAIPSPPPADPLITPTPPATGGTSPIARRPGQSLGSPIPAQPHDLSSSRPPSKTSAVLTPPARQQPHRARQQVPHPAPRRRGRADLRGSFGDDSVLKVVCQKVDIKSPEKGNGPSAVKACGQVRFAGFGAEGTCEESAIPGRYRRGRHDRGCENSGEGQARTCRVRAFHRSVKYKIDPQRCGNWIR